MPLATMPPAQFTERGGVLTRAARAMLDAYIALFRGSPANCTMTWGAGSPENVVTASVGSVFFRTDGGASTTLYIKESGTGATGWVAK